MTISNWGHGAKKMRRLPLGSVVRHALGFSHRCPAFCVKLLFSPMACLLCSLSPLLLSLISLCFGFSLGDMSSGRWPSFLSSGPRPASPSRGWMSLLLCRVGSTWPGAHLVALFPGDTPPPRHCESLEGHIISCLSLVPGVIAERSGRHLTDSFIPINC